MTGPTRPPRLAIAQVPMHWDLADNVRTMTRALAVARDDGAAVCAFAELAVTGFHRRIVDWGTPEHAGPAVDTVRAAAAALGIAAVFGAPTFGPGGLRLNSHLFVDADGRLAGAVHKAGLTEAEATFFAAGRDRPVIALAGLACTAVICREVEDHDVVVDQLAGQRVDLVFWPGLMRPDPARPPADPPEHVRQAQALARALSAHVVQSNWPNALNRPAESAGCGRSACIGPTGELMFRLPEQGLGVATFELGAGTYRWQAWTD